MNITCLGSLFVLTASIGVTIAQTQSPAIDQAQPSMRPAPSRPKPARYTIPAGWARDVVSVKFRDGLTVRLRDGTLSDLGTGALAKAQPVLERLRAGTWSRTFTVAEAELDRLRALGEQNVGFALHDLNLLFRCQLPAGVDTAPLIDALNALDCVEMAESLPGAAPPPQAPDYRYRQGYCEPAPRGTGAGSLRGLPDNNQVADFAARGGHARIVDIEYGFDQAHVELPPIAMLTAPGFTFPAYDMHGTAVFGLLSGRNDGFGTTGMAPAAQLWFARAYTPAIVYDIDNSIMVATSVVGPGAIVLIEQQITGPNWTAGQFGLVAVEWHYPTYLTIRNAVAAGLHVVEAAGNGSQNLDDPIYGGAFAAQNDSGALMVGAGIAPPASAPVAPVPPFARSRVSTSNYGETLDLQGWGENMVTPGYGDLYSVGGPAMTYTQVFGGTSGASAIVAGACALVTSLHIERHAFQIAPWYLRSALRRSGTPQTGTVTQNIGPMPDVVRTAVELRLYRGVGVAHGFGQSMPGLGGNGLQFTGVESILAMAELDDDGPGSHEKRLYVAGQFPGIGGRLANNVAVWNGVGWEQLGAGLNGTVRALVAHDPDGPGPQVGVLYAGGFFPGGVARWDPTSSTWPIVGSGLQGGGVYSLAMLGGTPVAGGEFTGTNGGVTPIARIARFVGTWQQLGAGFDGRVAALEVHAGQLVAGGMFRNTGSGVPMPMRSLATWNGAAWSELGGGVGSFGDSVFALESIPIANTSGSGLFVGGTFWTAGGVPTASQGVAVWTFGGWWMPWTGATQPFAIAGFDDGSDPTVPRQVDAYLSCATGQYRFDLTTFVPTMLPMNAAAAECMLAFDEDGPGVEPPSLLIGGQLFAGPAPSAGLAKLFGAPPASLTSLTTIMATGCGGYYEPTIATTSEPVLGAPFTVQFDCLPMSLPAFCAGLPQPFAIPLCGGNSCAIGVDPIVIDIGKQSGTYTLPNFPTFLGVTLAFQGLELLALPYGPPCVPTFLPMNLRTSNTLLLTF